MFRHVLVLGTCVALLSCAGGSSSEQASESAAHQAKAAGGEATATHTAKAPAQPVRQPQPSAAKASVLDQGNDEGDLDLTQRIRKQLMADDALSFSAKNVKVITQSGVVTLAGSVNSEAEAQEVRQKAIAEAGEGHVKDELQISP